MDNDVERGGFAYEIVVASPRWVVNGVNVAMSRIAEILAPTELLAGA